MKLIHSQTKEEIKEGSQILFHGEIATVIYCPPPHKPSSEGKMQAQLPNGETTTEYYCSVFDDCEWIEREDRE